MRPGSVSSSPAASWSRSHPRPIADLERGTRRLLCEDQERRATGPLPEQAMPRVIGGFVRGPIAFWLFHHVRAPGVAANLGRAAGCQG